MKALKLTFLTTGIALFLSLALASCGKSNGEPEPPELPPVDTVVVEEPDTIILGNGFYNWARDQFVPYLKNLECMNKKIKTGERWLSEDIVGKWQLLMTYDLCPTDVNHTTDYSCRSVLYVFDADSTLTVISDTTAIPSGTFKYSFGFVSHDDYLQLGLYIDGKLYDCDSLSDDIYTDSRGYFHEDGQTRTCTLRVFLKVRE